MNTIGIPMYLIDGPNRMLINVRTNMQDRCEDKFFYSFVSQTASLHNLHTLAIRDFFLLAVVW